MTEYESKPYRSEIFHILYGNCFLNRKNVENMKFKKLLSSEFFQTYLDKKLQINKVALATSLAGTVLHFLAILMYLACGQHVLYKHFSERAISHRNSTVKPKCIGWIFSVNFTETILTFPTIIFFFCFLLLSLIFYIFSGVIFVCNPWQFAASPLTQRTGAG